MKKQKSKIVDGIFYGIEVTIEDEKLIKVHNRDGTKFKDIKPQAFAASYAADRLKTLNMA